MNWKRKCINIQPISAGLNSGFVIPQYTTAALLTENKTLCFPATADSIPTSLAQEVTSVLEASAGASFIKSLITSNTSSQSNCSPPARPWNSGARSAVPPSSNRPIASSAATSPSLKRTVFSPKTSTLSAISSAPAFSPPAWRPSQRKTTLI